MTTSADQAATASPDSPMRPAPTDSIQGLDSVCEHGHVDSLGICVRCGAWLPEAVCRQPECDWHTEPGESTLREAVEHRNQRGHTVRVRVG